MIDNRPLPPLSQRWGFVMALLGMFMAILDIQIVASSLNEIQAGVSATPDEISWIQTAYLIAEVIMIPLSGVLTRWLSTRLAFVVSCVSFTLASIGCATAQSIDQLIVLRAIQGFVGGAMIPIAYSISFSIFPARVMGMVQAVIGMIATMAPSLGPTLGGYITQHAGWHWLFLMNVVPGVLASTGVWLLLDINKPQFDLFRKIDFVGLVWLALFLGPLEYVLEEGPDNDWFEDPFITGMTLLCITSAALFLRRTLKAEFPIVDLRVFRNRNFSVGTAIGFVIGIALYGLVYLMPLFLGGIRHFNSLQIGSIMFVTGAAMFFTAPVAGRLTDKMDTRYLLTLGLTLVGIGSLMNAHLTTDADFIDFFWPQIVRGMGMLMCLVTAARIALGTLPPSEISNAAGLFNVVRNLGGAVGLAAMDTLRDIRVDYHWHQLIPAVNGARDVVLQQVQQFQGVVTGAVSDASAAGIARLAQRVLMQAEVLSFNDLFLWLGIVYLCAVPMTLLMRKPVMQSAGH